VSSLSLALPDVERGERFYAGLLGWTFTPGQPGREQGASVTPQVGLWTGHRAGCEVVRGAVPGYRVAVIGDAIARVRELGGAASAAVGRPYGLEAACADNQGLPFFLHQLPDHPVDDGTDRANGLRHGDVAYLTIGVPVLGAAESFYGPLFGWSFSSGSTPDGRQIGGVTPMAGLWAGEAPGVVPAYRVDDLGAAVARVEELGGHAGAVDERPYGLAADLCTDDQGIRFNLLQLR
jgi:predicted enzyme related to lactoylglutathione lyase